MVNPRSEVCVVPERSAQLRSCAYAGPEAPDSVLRKLATYE